MNYINIPGLDNSGPTHWQTLWEEECPHEFSRVRQKNWSAPDEDDWVKSVDAAISTYDSPVILIAHSLGCITVAHWAAENKSSVVIGALLVAPADAEQSKRKLFSSFCPIPRVSLPFPSIVVASTDDPYITIDNAKKLAGHWGSRFFCVGDKGHINADSGLRAWNEGLSLLSALTENYLPA